MAMEPYAEVGDLVFCHTCGNKYGWTLNQFGLVQRISVVSETRSTALRVYRIWLFGLNQTELVRDDDFKKKNLELVSRASGNNAGLVFPRITDLEKYKKRLFIEVT